MQKRQQASVYSGASRQKLLPEQSEDCHTSKAIRNDILKIHIGEKHVTIQKQNSHDYRRYRLFR